MPANLENSAVATGLEQVSFHSNLKDKQCQRMLKLLHNCTHLNMLVKWCWNFSKSGFNSMWTVNFQMFSLDLEKAEEPEIKLEHLFDHQKARELQRNIYFCFIDYAKAFDCVAHSKLENS